MLPTKLKVAVLLAIGAGMLQTENEVKPWSDVPTVSFFRLLSLSWKTTLQSFVETHENWRGKYGDVYKTSSIFGSEAVHIHNIEDVVTLITNEGKMVDQPGYLGFDSIKNLPEFEKYFSTGLGFAANGSKWYSIRQDVNEEMMNPERSNYFIKDIEEITQEFLLDLSSKLDENSSVDVSPHLNQYVIDCIWFILAGTTLGKDEGRQLIENTELVIENSMPFGFIPVSIARWLPFYSRVTSGFRRMWEIIDKLVQNKIDTIEMDDKKDQSTIAILTRKLGNDSKIPLFLAMDGLFAGGDTGGKTSSFLVYHLATHPEIQELLHQEVINTIGATGNLTLDTLDKMKYVKAFLTESQRIQSIIPVNARITQVEMVLGGYKIPIGTKVLRYPQLLQNDIVQFDQPDKFMPERWIEGHPSYHKSNLLSHQPFSYGVRSCVGQQFAKRILEILLVKTVQRYRLEYTGEDVVAKMGFACGPDKEVVVKFIQK